jgi:transcription elongation factor Elf1
MSARIAFPCRHCGERNIFEADRAGKTVLCAHCGLKIEVPAPPSRSGSGSGSGPLSTKPPGKIKIGCGLCGHRQFVDAALAGQAVVCEACGKKVRVPSQSGPAARPAPAGPTSPAHPATAQRRETSRPQEEPLAAVESLSALDADVYGLEEAAVVLPPRDSLMPAPAAPVDGASGTPKKKKKKKKGGAVGLEKGEILGTIGAIAGTIVVVGILVVALPGARMPLGIILCVAGFITTLVGNYGLRQAASEAGPFQYLLCRFVPLYSILFILTHWEDTRGHLAIYCVGASLLLPGLGIFGMAELHEKGAARAEKAHTHDAEEPPAAELVDDEADPN